MTAAERPAVVAMVPTRDEAPAMPRFLRAALLWADAVVVFDQHSVDGTADVARSFDRVTVIEDRRPEYSEEYRQQRLIEVARRLVPGPRFLVALDADELLSANVLSSPAWEAAVRSAPGTCVQLSLAQLCETPSHYLMEWGADRGIRGTFAYADDGRPHTSRTFHATRVPEYQGAPEVVLDDVVVLHFSLADSAKMRSKERWYQCFERLQHPEFDDVTIRRHYDWLKRLEGTFNIRPSPAQWFAGYRDQGVDLNEGERPDVYWTDWGVLRIFALHGVQPFARLDIWSFDWEALRRRGLAEGVTGLPDAPIVRPDAIRHRLVRHLLSRSGRWRHGRYVDAAVARILRARAAPG